MKGQIVSVVLEDLTETEGGFMLERNKDTGMLAYEVIDLESYPSFDDFRGKTTRVSDGDIATILSFVGRPGNINRSIGFQNYDVYEILIHGEIRQMFRHCLRNLNEPAKEGTG